MQSQIGGVGGATYLRIHLQVFSELHIVNDVLSKLLALEVGQPAQNAVQRNVLRGNHIVPLRPELSIHLIRGICTILVSNFFE